MMENSERTTHKRYDHAKRYEQMRDKVTEELLKRKAAENRALELVMKLIEPDITEQTLKSLVKQLNPDYYKDIVVERGLTLLCGYPICANRLKPINHRQKYKINTRENRVYDVSERKYFCSNECFKASKYLEDQLCEEPLWARLDHIPKPEIRLYHEALQQSNPETLQLSSPDNDTSMVIGSHTLQTDDVEELEDEMVRLSIRNGRGQLSTATGEHCDDHVVEEVDDENEFRGNAGDDDYEALD